MASSLLPHVCRARQAHASQQFRQVLLHRTHTESPKTDQSIRHSTPGASHANVIDNLGNA
jgi:hypothetical protein